MCSVIEPTAKQTLRRLVVGVGNADRGDDAVGQLVARLLRGRVPADVELLEHDGEATSLLERLATVDTAYLIDAAVSGAAPGAVRRFDCSQTPLPRDALSMSTHGFGPVEAIELARALGQLPACCIVYAIEAGSVDGGADISTEIARAAEAVATRIAAELSVEAEVIERTGHA